MKALPPPTKSSNINGGSQGGDRSAQKLGHQGFGDDDGDDEDEDGDEGNDSDNNGFDGDGGDDDESDYFDAPEDLDAELPDDYFIPLRNHRGSSMKNEGVFFGMLTRDDMWPSKHWQAFLDRMDEIQRSNIAIKRDLTEYSHTIRHRVSTAGLDHQLLIQLTLEKNRQLELYVQRAVHTAGVLWLTGFASSNELAQQVLAEVISICRVFDDPKAAKPTALMQYSSLQKRLGAVLEALQRELWHYIKKKGFSRSNDCKEIVEKFVREKCPTPEDSSSHRFVSLAQRSMNKIARELEIGIRDDLSSNSLAIEPSIYLASETVKSLNENQLVSWVFEDISKAEMDQYQERCFGMLDGEGIQRGDSTKASAHKGRWAFDFQHANEEYEGVRLIAFGGKWRGIRHTVDVGVKDAQRMGWAYSSWPLATWMRNVTEDGFIFTVNKDGKVLGLYSHDGTFIKTDMLNDHPGQMDGEGLPDPTVDPWYSYEQPSLGGDVYSD